MRISDWSSDVFSSDRGETRPDALIIVLDAANLDNHLNFALELLALNLPTVVALNMVDLATRDGLTLDAGRLSKGLGVPVVPTVAVRKRGLTELLAAVDGAIRATAAGPAAPPSRNHPANRTTILYETMGSGRGGHVGR